ARLDEIILAHSSRIDKMRRAPESRGDTEESVPAAAAPPRSANDFTGNLLGRAAVCHAVGLNQTERIGAWPDGMGQLNEVVDVIVAAAAAAPVFGAPQLLLPCNLGAAGRSEFDPGRKPRDEGRALGLVSQAGQLAIDDDALPGLKRGFVDRVVRSEGVHA